MREIARVAQGYFPTQSRVVHAISRLVVPPQHGTVTVLDAGCGCGDAIDELRNAWQSYARTDTTVKLYGIESDRERHRVAESRFSQSGGEAIWAAIEDCDSDRGASLLWFNPPYDKIRGAGRMELELFHRVRGWCGRDGVLVLIVPDYVLSEIQTGLASAVERHFHPLGIYRYPEPEYKSFRQCVLIAQRRDKPLNHNRVEHPNWADCKNWPVLPDAGYPIATLTIGESIKLRRTCLSTAVIQDALSHSPLRNSLLREALAPAAPIERPLLPLKAGHLALALAGGLCDGVVEKDGVRFLVKGTLSRKNCQTKTTQKLDADGNKIADVDIFRTVYAMNVRCLRDDGSIEDYSSNDGEDVGSDSESGEGEAE